MEKRDYLPSIPMDKRKLKQMSDRKQLETIELKCGQKRFVERGSMLSDLLEGYMQRNILPKQKKCAPLVEVFNQLLPAELACHCKIESINGRILNVLVDSPSYRHELNMCSKQLLIQLTKMCPRAGIKEIRFKIGSWKS